jgi:biopolymer transport protein ExbD
MKKFLLIVFFVVNITLLAQEKRVYNIPKDTTEVRKELQDKEVVILQFRNGDWILKSFGQISDFTEFFKTIEPRKFYRVITKDKILFLYNEQ